MGRRVIVWSVAAGLAVGTASLSVAASSAIEAPAQVRDRAQRAQPVYEPDRTPEERAVEEMVTLINMERVSRGLPFLRLDPRATAAASAHAADMAANRRMQHQGSDGSDGGMRLTREGYVWVAWAENIGAGFVDPQTLFDAWMGSPSHRANLLGDFLDIGIGAAATSDGVPYWSLIVAKAPYVPGQF